MICSNCTQDKPRLTGAMLNGKFGNYCDTCLNLAKRPASASSAQYARDRDREAHEADLIQPWDKSGNPSAEFIRLYPNESKDMFTEDELKKFA